MMRKWTVVVAEDDFLVSKEVVRAVHEAGFTVVGTAADGEEALDLVKRLGPDVAILDIEMPGMGGLEAARRMRQDHPLPVVILTAYESAEFVRQAAEAGVGAYLTKPPDASALQRAVEIAVARHDDQMELRRLNLELQQALDEVRTLRGLLPMCSGCRKIRDDDAWVQLESYVIRQTEARFTHTFCPDCLRIYYPDLAEKVIKSLPQE